jgi:hypothetical protein
MREQPRRRAEAGLRESGENEAIRRDWVVLLRQSLVHAPAGSDLVLRRNGLLGAGLRRFVVEARLPVSRRRLVSMTCHFDVCALFRLPEKRAEARKGFDSDWRTPLEMWVYLAAGVALLLAINLLVVLLLGLTKQDNRGSANESE